jgi:hypothetical protein
MYLIFFSTGIRQSVPTSLDEYVDILQVQQLLLENSSTNTNSIGTISAASNPTSSSSGNKIRPKVNLQKASEYSNQVQG